jgi:glucose/arabinose dehydrogenase
MILTFATVTRRKYFPVGSCPASLRGNGHCDKRQTHASEGILDNVGLQRIFWIWLFIFGWTWIPPAVAQDYRVETIAEGLSYPWSIAFLPDGEILVTERDGYLRSIRDGQLNPVAIRGVPEVYVAGQGGLFDVVIDPDYERTGYIYLSYAQGSRKANATQVARARLEENQLVDLEVIFTVEPTKDTPHHFGGRMAWMTDGTLLVTTGDGFDFREKAQVLESLLGKIIRINPDGSIPDDNPFIGRSDARPEIWSYGHRNPQAILRDPHSGKVYSHEHGPRGGDELNIIEPGQNYGWPVITWGIDYNGAKISPYTEYPGMEQPLEYWVPSIAPGGMDIYYGDVFPAWQGDIFVAALAEKTIRRLDMEDGAVVGQQILFENLGERMRDVRVGPDGFLYLLTDSSPNGKVLRVIGNR